MPEKTQILLVDDEPSILVILENVMQMSLDCETTTASNGLEALEAMKERQFDVIVSDIKMPSMDGIELLKVVREIYPQTVRLAFTGKPGGDVGIRVADSAHQFFTKPLDVRIISEKINKILKLRGALPKEALDQIVAHVGHLPSMPNMCVRIEEELRQEKASIERAAAIIEGDIAMSAKVLQMVNSSFFGLREKITEISQAASLLGIDVVKSLALAAHVFSEWKGVSARGFSPEALYRHCLGVASRARKIAERQKCGDDAEKEMYAAGLFHDIGKLVMAGNLPESVTEIERLAADRKTPLASVEKAVMGATHAEIGAYLLVLWGLPDRVVNAAAYHHRPGEYLDEQGFNCVTAVHAANVIEHETGEPAESTGATIDMKYLETLGLAAELPAWRGL